MTHHDPNESITSLLRHYPKRVLVAIPRQPFGDAENDYKGLGYSVVVAGDGPILDSVSKKLKIDFSTALRVVSQAMRDDPDIIYAANEAIGLAIALLKRLGFLERQKLVIYNNHPLSDGPFGSKIALTLLGEWDKMVCTSQDEENEFARKYRVSCQKVTSNLFPYNVNSFAPKREEEKYLNRYAISVGVSKRDYGTLIEAAEILKQSDFRLCVDPSSPSDRLKDSDWRKNLPENTRQVHYPDPSSFTAAIEMALFVAIAIVPNTNQKSAGCTLVQAGASAGIPTVAASNGLTGFIVGGLTGILVRPQDPQILAEALHELWSNGELRIKMGRAAREFAEANFSLSAHYSRLREILGQM